MHPGKKKKFHHHLHPINKRGGGIQAGSWLRGSAAWTRGPSPSGKHHVRTRPSPCNARPSSVSSDTNLLSPRSEWIQVTHRGHLRVAPCTHSQGRGCWCQPGKALQRATDRQRVGYQHATLAVADWTRKNILGIQCGCRTCTDPGVPWAS